VTRSSDSVAVVYAAAVYSEYRECLEQARMSALFVPCGRLISRTHDQLYNVAPTMDRQKLALTTCQ